MTDKLKQYIDEHRGLFDTEVPDQQLFKSIQEQLPGNTPVKSFQWNTWKMVAAAVAVLFIASAVYFLLPKNGKAESPVAREVPPAHTDNGAINEPLYAKQIIQFREVIGLQQSELKKLEKDYPQLYHQFVTDINELDSSYQSLKIKLQAIPNREMLLEAMIQNLQLQSELLNRQLLIIKEIKQQSKSYEKNTI